MSLAQGTSVAPTATDEFRGHSLCLSLGLQSRLVSQAGPRQPPASAGSRQEHGGKDLSRADSETKPFGARWEIAAFATAEKCSGADAEVPCQPRELHCLRCSSSRGCLPASRSLASSGI